MPEARGLVTRLRLKQRARVPAGPPLARFQANRLLRASSLSDTPAASLVLITVTERLIKWAWMQGGRRADAETYELYVAGRRETGNAADGPFSATATGGGGGVVTGGRMAEREGTAAAAPECPRRGEARCLSPKGESRVSNAGVDRLRSSAKLATDRRRPATARTVTRLQ